MDLLGDAAWKDSFREPDEKQIRGDVSQTCVFNVCCLAFEAGF